MPLRGRRTGVPGVAEFRIHAAQALAEALHAVRNRKVRDKFHIFVAKLARNPQTERSAMSYRKFIAVHRISEKSLRVHRIGHVDAFPGVGLYREVNDVSGLRMDANRTQHVGEAHADPFGDVRPPLLTREFGNLVVRWITPQLIERKRAGPIDQAIDREAPIDKFSSLKTLESLTRSLDFVRERARRDRAARKLARHRVPRQQSLGCVRQRFARAVNSAVIGRNQSIFLRKASRNTDPGCTRRSRESTHGKVFGV